MLQERFEVQHDCIREIGIMDDVPYIRLRVEFGSLIKLQLDPFEYVELKKYLKHVLKHNFRELEIQTKNKKKRKRNK